MDLGNLCMKPQLHDTIPDLASEERWHPLGRAGDLQLGKLQKGPFREEDRQAWMDEPQATESPDDEREAHEVQGGKGLLGEGVPHRFEAPPQNGNLKN